MLQVRDMQDRIEREKKKEAQLKKRVQLHNTLKTKDQVRDRMDSSVFFFFLFSTSHHFSAQCQKW